MRIYKDFFLKFVTARYYSKRIIEELNKIKIDAKHSNGRISNKNTIITFIKACEECLCGNTFSKENLTIIENFIYLIRCNLFHGSKTMNDLNFPEQQVRLDIYSTFIVAINQMVFSYLDYLTGKDITKDFAYLLEKLKWAPKQDEWATLNYK